MRRLGGGAGSRSARRTSPPRPSCERVSVVLQYTYVCEIAHLLNHEPPITEHSPRDASSPEVLEEPLDLESGEEEADERLDHGGAAGGVVHAVEGV